jgi:ABC-type multidrug transport system ATPase subunit
MATKAVTAGEEPRRRRGRVTFDRKGVRHLLAAYDLNADKLYGHVKTEGRSTFLVRLPLPAQLVSQQVRIAFVLENFSLHLSTKRDDRVGDCGRGEQRRVCIPLTR